MLAGILGAALACFGYLALQLKVVSMRGYAVLNLCAGSLIGVSLIGHFNLGSAMMQVFFASVSLWTLFKGSHMTQYSKLREANRARQAEWDPSDSITLAYRGNELAGEVGEACNVLKKLERERLGIPGSRDTKQHLAEELADVIICADLIAMDQGINLDRAVAEKFNATSEKVGLSTRMEVPT